MSLSDLADSRRQSHWELFPRCLAEDAVKLAFDDSDLLPSFDCIADRKTKSILQIGYFC